MAKRSVWEKWKHLLTQPVYPNVGVEINSDCVRLAALSVRKGKIQVDHMDSVPLPSDAIQVNPFKANILQVDPVAEALRLLWSRNRNRPPKICLLLQDRAALAFQVALESVPENHQDCMDVIRFKLKKNVPFRIEEARIHYFLDSGQTGFNSANLWVTVINHQVLHQYEEIVRSAIGSECGLVDLATFNLMNLAHSEIRTNGWEQDDHLYVNWNRNYISLAITQKEKLMFFRSRELEGYNGVLDEAMAEIHPTLMFYMDKLGGQQLSRVFVYTPDRPEELTRQLEQLHGIKTVVLNPNTALRESKPFAPLLGLLMSRKVEAL